MTRLRVLFGGEVFLAAFLLFMVEPIAARQLLPIFGGSSAVWITCLVFFQTALLVAYLYAHWLARRSHWILHLAMLAVAAASAISWAARTMGTGSGSQHPVSSIFAALGLTIGLPFLVLGSTSPLLQVWLARLEMRGIPYQLFALSNLASLLALALYPTVVEPHLTLRAQRIGWSGGFVCFACLATFITWRTRSVAPSNLSADLEGAGSETQATFRQKILWVLLPMGAAMQLAAVTSYLTQNVAAIPLLWILPLGVYLVTLILAFQFPRLLPRSILSRFLVVMLAGLGCALTMADVSWPLGISIGFFLAEVFFACLFCHTEAYALRPGRASESTLFYLLFAAGGALGAFLIGIVSPLVFSFNYDLAITFFITALLALAATWSSHWANRLLWGAAGVMMLVLVAMLYVANHRGTPIAVRNFYGSLRVRESLAAYPGAILRTLTNGSIQHGTQIFSPELRRTPTTYYAEDSGVGLALRFCCKDRPRNIGVVGLGVGTIAAYGRAGDRIRFYEINPAVIPIARNVFTYLRESGAQISVVEGDARSSLSGEPPQNFDVLAVDAFSGDAIPIHLLTTQAVTLYKRNLAPGGILAFHVSNRHVDLEPEIALLGAAAGMDVRTVTSAESEQRDEFVSTWVLLTTDSGFFDHPEVARAVHLPGANSRLRLWTDDYSSLLPILHWGL